MHRFKHDIVLFRHGLIDNACDNDDDYYDNVTRTTDDFDAKFSLEIIDTIAAYKNVS